MKNYLNFIKLLLILVLFSPDVLYALSQQSFSVNKEKKSTGKLTDCSQCHLSPDIKNIDLSSEKFNEIHTKLLSNKQWKTENALIGIKLSADIGEYNIVLSWELKDRSILLKSDISEFKVFYGLESKKYSENREVGNVYSFNVRGLKKGEGYFFIVKGYGEKGDEIAVSKELGPVVFKKENIISEIEKRISRSLPSTISLGLHQFGYSIFNSDISFTPVSDMPVGPDYILGTGDSITINIWGGTDMELTVTVDRDGKIMIPQVGSIHIWGLTYKEVKSLIYNKISKIISNFEMSISIGSLRNIKVYVVGEVERPGAYDLSSLSTVINALFAAGGPSKNGSMRNISLLRNNKLISKIDLYTFLMKGKKNNDLKLQSGDTIFVPIVGKVAGIAGNVKRPAIYELTKKDSSLSNIIEMAGGITSAANINKLQIDRTSGNKRNIIIDITMKDQDNGNFSLEDGDLVKVFSVYPLSQNFVELKGNIEYPGRYELKGKMRLADLLKKGGRLLLETYMRRIEIERLLPYDKRKKTIPVNLKKLLEGDKSENKILKPWDIVTVFTIHDFGAVPAVTIEGSIIRPGEYELSTSMRLSDLIYMAGGLERNAYLRNAELTRFVSGQNGVLNSSIISLDLEKIIKDNNKKENILLKENDRLFVKELPGWQDAMGTVTLTGEFVFPGVYNIQKGERLSSLIKRAGGVTTDSFLKGIVFTRESVRKEEHKIFQKFLMEREKEMAKQEATLLSASLSSEEASILKDQFIKRKEFIKSMAQLRPSGRILVNHSDFGKTAGLEGDIVLEGGDSINIPRKPASISLFGEVYNPSSIMFKGGKSLQYYISKVGGFKKTANMEGIYIIKADGSVLSADNVRASLDDRGYLISNNTIPKVIIDRGDSVYVPEKFVEKVRWWQVTKETVDMLYKVGLSVAAVSFIFN